MIEQNVQIVRCQDERLWVRLGSQAGCRACKDGKGCGAGVFAKLFHRKPVILELPRNQVLVEAGQMLTLALPERLYVRLVMVSYGLPLVVALAGGLAGFSLAAWLGLSPLFTDISTLIAGLIGASTVLGLIRHRQRAGLFHDCVQSIDYYPAAEAGMCSESHAKPMYRDR